jgi:hypothetical protein
MRHVIKGSNDCLTLRNIYQPVDLTAHLPSNLWIKAKFTLPLKTLSAKGCKSLNNVIVLKALRESKERKVA